MSATIEAVIDCPMCEGREVIAVTRNDSRDPANAVTVDIDCPCDGGKLIIHLDRENLGYTIGDAIDAAIAQAAADMDARDFESVTDDLNTIATGMSLVGKLGVAL